MNDHETKIKECGVFINMNMEDINRRGGMRGRKYYELYSQVNINELGNIIFI
jgi:hypothetical protein